jgi:hypothetical protein
MRLPLAVTWSVTFNDLTRTYAAYYEPLGNTIIATAEEWGLYFPHSKASIELGVDFTTSSDTPRASSTSETDQYLRTDGGVDVYEGSVPYEIRTGKDPNGDTRDAHLTFNADYLANVLWFDPTPRNRGDEAVPRGKVDAYSVALHELGHVLGFSGWRDYTTGALPDKYESNFDELVTIDQTGTPYFNGPAAEAAYGNTPVPLTYTNLMHVGNDTSGVINGVGRGHPGSDLVEDLMNGVVTYLGQRYEISPLDLDVLRDLDLPVAIVNHPPTLDLISDLPPIPEDSGPQTVYLSGILSGINESQVLTVRAVSSNASLIPDPTVQYTSPDQSGTLILTPVANQSGTATITVTVQDNGGTAGGGIDSVVQKFKVTVLPVNDPPSFNLHRATLPFATLIRPRASLIGPLTLPAARRMKPINRSARVRPMDSLSITTKHNYLPSNRQSMPTAG